MSHFSFTIFTRCHRWLARIGHEGSFQLMTCIKHPDWRKTRTRSINTIFETHLKHALHAFHVFSLSTWTDPKVWRIIFISRVSRASMLLLYQDHYWSVVCAMKQTSFDLDSPAEKTLNANTKSVEEVKWSFSRRLASVPRLELGPARFSFHSKVKTSAKIFFRLR